jgi:hypothetical protein
MAFVLAGLPTTTTLTFLFAWSLSAFPVSTKIFPLSLSKSDLSIPGPIVKYSTSGFGSYQKSKVDILKSDSLTISAYDASQGGERAVIKLHLDSFYGILHCWNFKEMENDGLVGSKHLAASNSENGCITDIACRSGDRDSYWGFLELDSYILNLAKILD